MKPEHIIKSLAGTWSLINSTYYKYEDLSTPSSNNTKQVGLLIYSPNGYVSANFVSTEPEQRPPHLIANQPDNGTDAEWAQIGKYALAYSGPFSINASVPATRRKGHILHGPLFVANLPSLENKILARNYLVFEEGGVQYLNLSISGNVQRADVLWKRIA
ncbi:hypothetical protein QBC34DRAFT_440889 [Podospora aff. communis PSN243]|uniref:Lipocalin-like domain-containing protein n=1 Tax=Podospora aff. communis PSN243 TaxID=3040156 RepID=A0AAV9GE78_9PEZI|nr:hypothetical protein QBC34DRAFT_440889 [Podospora aff. communis PSN243]